MKFRTSSAVLCLFVVSASACFSGRKRGAKEPVKPAPVATPGATPVTPVDSAAAKAGIERRATDTTKQVAVEAKPPAKAPVAERSTERCILDLENTPETRSQFVQDPVSGKYFSYIGGGVRGKCRNQDIRISADSAESYDQSQLYHLIGNVHYREPRIALDAQRATYFRAEERIVMETNVHAVMPNGTVMDATRAEYLRAVRGIRTQSKLIANQRPALMYTEKDSVGKALPTVTINANDITAEGESTFVAVGNVVMNRSDLVATGDSAFVDNGRHTARLMKKPRIQSKGEQAYVLTGRVIDLFGASRQVDRVVSIDSAHVTSKGLELLSDTIDLRVRQNKLQRAYAFGPGGARATTPERDIVADSLDVVMPSQRIRELRAVRKAYAESDPDSTKIISDERDWLRGDTIVARFDSLPPNDTTAKPRVREIVATGNASSYYQVAASKGPKDRPGVNYVRGSQILVNFAQGEVQTVTVKEEAAGMYLEAEDSAAAARKAKIANPRGGSPASRPPAATRRPPTGIRRPPADHELR
jgi:lipopolysaccharide export system protein LptA